MPVSTDVGLKGQTLATTSHQARHTSTVTWVKATRVRALGEGLALCRELFHHGQHSA